MRFTLTTKLLAAFSALAMVAALPGAGLWLGVVRLERATHQNHRELESRDACGSALAAVNGALTALENHTLFPDDPRFSEAARNSLTSAERALRLAQVGLSSQEADTLSREFAELRLAGARLLEAPEAAETNWQTYQTAKTIFLGDLDRIITEITGRLDRHDVAVADTVDRLSRLGGLGLGATVALALLLALSLGAAFRARMVSLRRGVEQITRGDMSVRIDDREGDEVGALARTFNQMAGELQLLEDMKSQVVAVASHELRTPLTLIDGYCGILLCKGPLSDWHRERVERIHDQVQELLLLVQDLLDAERLQERALAPVLEPFQPDLLATSLAGDFESEARARGLQLKLVIGHGTPARGLADVRALTRVVRNLLDNAVKYTATGEVRMELAGAPGWLLLTVSDTGCGIAPEELPRIFRRFYQVQGTVRPRRGFGLGLSIVKGLVERNHGTIEASSAVGRGTSFSVRWPVGDRPLQRSAG